MTEPTPSGPCHLGTVTACIWQANTPPRRPLIRSGTRSSSAFVRGGRSVAAPATCNFQAACGQSFVVLADGLS